MGYSCPVCGDPQADGVHLANHLAFTALVRGGEHEVYLDDHVPEWAEMDETELAAELTQEADETEYPQVFEDTTGRAHDHGESREHDHSHGGGHGHRHGQERSQEHTRRTDQGTLPDGFADTELTGDDVDTASILQEAKELTRKRQEGKAGSDAQGTEDSAESETDSETE